MKKCMNCGRMVNDNENFCSGCGGQYFESVANTVSNVNTGENGLAIAALILSLVGLHLLGLIFGCIGLSKSKKLNGKGRGLSIAAIIISVVAIILVISAISANVLYKANQKSAFSDAKNALCIYVTTGDGSVVVPEETIFVVEKAGNTYTFVYRDGLQECELTGSINPLFYETVTSADIPQLPSNVTIYLYRG